MVLKQIIRFVVQLRSFGAALSAKKLQTMFGAFFMTENQGLFYFD